MRFRSERAEAAPDLRDRRGRADGVELVGPIAELTRRALAVDFRHIDAKSARILLCEPEERNIEYEEEALRHFEGDL